MAPFNYVVAHRSTTRALGPVTEEPNVGRWPPSLSVEPIDHLQKFAPIPWRPGDGTSANTPA
jgi:hypothetical protein